MKKSKARVMFICEVRCLQYKYWDILRWPGGCSVGRMKHYGDDNHKTICLHIVPNTKTAINPNNKVYIQLYYYMGSG